MKNRQSYSLLFAACIVGSAWFGHRVNAAPLQISFDVIADSSTSPPEQPDWLFRSFPDNAHRIFDGAVYFVNAAYGDSPFGETTSGIYKWNNGDLTRFFNPDTPIPGNEQLTFTSFGNVYIKNDVFVFSGSSSELVKGVYRIIGDKVVRVIDNNTPIINSDLILSSFSNVRTDGKNVIFEALLENPVSGVISDSIMSATIDGQNLRVLVDENTPFPGQPQPLRGFTGIGGFENGRLAFFATNNPSFEIGDIFGAYTVDLTGNIEFVADGQTVLPGGSSDISFFNGSNPAITGDTVVFAASSPEGDGIYGRDLNTGELFTIVDDQTEYPDLPGQQTTIMTDPALDGDNLAFTVIGLDDRFPMFGFHAIMMRIDGQLHRVLGKGDMFQGRELEFLRMNSESFEGRSVVFYARFTDGFEGVYLATLIPTPATGAVLASFGAFALRRRR